MQKLQGLAKDGNTTVVAILVELIERAARKK